MTEQSLELLGSVQVFLMTVAEARLRVQRAAIDCIDAQMIEQFYFETHNEIDILSTHHEVLGYMVTGINCKHHDNATITLEVTGKVQVRLQGGW